MKSAVFTGLLAAFASAVAALTPPVGSPQGNPIIKPGKDELVEAGKPYDITWNPTSKGTVSLVLLRGPSTNVKPLETIVEGIPNSGQYSWTPSTRLQDDVTHYGLQLIEDATGYFQYSTQFGISNKSPKPSPETPPTPETPAQEGPKDTTPYGTTPPVYAATPSPYGTTPPVEPEQQPTVVYSTHIATVTDCNCGPTPTGSGSMPAYQNSTGSVYSAPVSPNNVTTPVPPVYTGAAAQFKAGSALAVIVAAMVFALF